MFACDLSFRLERREREIERERKTERERVRERERQREKERYGGRVRSGANVFPAKSSQRADILLTFAKGAPIFFAKLETCCC